MKISVKRSPENVLDVKPDEVFMKTDVEIVGEIGYTVKFHGEVSEWSMVPDSKSGVRQRT